MNIPPAYLVGIGGAVGAALRHLVGLLVADDRLPVSTLTVNVVGSFALGAVTFLSVGSESLLFVGTGVCGAFTTFSSFSVDVVQLWDANRRRAALGYAAANTAGGLLAVGLAWVLVRGL